MLTDDQARDLLQQAAATIEVDPAGPMDLPPHRPWWPVVAAAAAVAVVATGLAVGLPDRGDDPEPAAPVPQDTSFRLGPDQVPSLFGYDPGTAVSRLAELGFAPSLQTVPGCGDGSRVLRTEPPVGSVVEPGATVTVWAATDASGAFCVADTDHEDGWGVLDLVAGRPSTLGLAPTVTAYDGDRATTLAAAEVADWRPLVDVVDAMTGVQRLDGIPTQSLLETRRTTEATCGTQPPTTLTGTAVSAGLPTDGTFLSCNAVVLFREGGLVTMLQVVRAPEPRTPPTVADVVGNSAAYATERLEAQGYDVVRAEGTSACETAGLVTAQEQVGDSVRLTVDDGSGRGCPLPPPNRP